MQEDARKARQTRLRKAMAASAAALVLTAQGGGAWDGGYTPSPQGIGNAFKLIEGAFGALVMVLSFLASFVLLFVIRKRRRRMVICGSLLAVACGTFVLRSIVSLFFGTDYLDYEAGGGGGSSAGATGSFSEASYEDSRIWSFGGGSGGSYSAAPSTVSPPIASSSYARSPVSYGTTERYRGTASRGWMDTTWEPISTFAADVDTGSYTNVRRFLRDGTLPPPDAVRIEELVNYFTYAYPAPEREPFQAAFEVAPSPFDSGKQILRIALRARDAQPMEDSGWNLVFLIDVSGSMSDQDKLPLLKDALSFLATKLRPQDRIAIVTYADSARVALPSTSGAHKQSILGTIDGLSAGGSTNGGDGLRESYALARGSFIPGGVNRVILATDGDFNVGTVAFDDLMQLIEEERKTGINLTSLGFGRGNLREDILEQLADRGDGNYFYIDCIEEAKRIFGRKLTATIEVVAKDVKLHLELNPAQVLRYRLLGFDNRAISEPEFNDDSTDGGEIGAGHMVTALYEITLAPGEQPAAGGTRASELGFLRIRYKEPGAWRSAESSFAITRQALRNASERSPDFNFAVAVAAFGELLRAPHSRPSFREIAAVAAANLGSDTDRERSEFVGMLERAAERFGETRPRRYE